MEDWSGESGSGVWDSKVPTKAPSDAFRASLGSPRAHEQALAGSAVATMANTTAASRRDRFKTLLPPRRSAGPHFDAGRGVKVPSHLVLVRKIILEQNDVARLEKGLQTFGCLVERVDDRYFGTEALPLPRGGSPNDGVPVEASDHDQVVGDR